MPVLICICGFRLEASAIPSSDAFLITLEASLDTVANALSQAHIATSGQEQFADKVYRIIGSGNTFANGYECRQCGRLAIRKSNERILRWYEPDPASPSAKRLLPEKAPNDTESGER